MILNEIVKGGPERASEAWFLARPRRRPIIVQPVHDRQVGMNLSTTCTRVRLVLLAGVASPVWHLVRAPPTSMSRRHLLYVVSSVSRASCSLRACPDHAHLEEINSTNGVKAFQKGFYVSPLCVGRRSTLSESLAGLVFCVS